MIRRRVKAVRFYGLGTWIIADITYLDKDDVSTTVEARLLARNRFSSYFASKLPEPPDEIVYNIASIRYLLLTLPFANNERLIKPKYVYIDHACKLVRLD